MAAADRRGAGSALTAPPGDRLMEGRTYGLSGQDPRGSHPQQSVIHVKLTDSALKALEQYQRSKGKHKAEDLTIQFLGHQGEIMVPGASGDESRAFQFVMASLSTDSKGSFECVAQRQNGMEVVGPIGNKLTVVANDDVYLSTREKFSAVEEESKRSAAKEIELSRPEERKAGHKVPRPSSFAPTRMRTSPALGRPSFKPVVAAAPSSRPDPPRSFVPSPNSALSGERSAFTVPSRPPKISPTVESRPFQSASAPPTSRQPATNRVVAMATTGGRSGSGGGSEGPTGGGSLKPLGNSGVIDFPLKERVVHLLALRAYTKPELLLRMQKDGLSERDKSSLTSTLEQVAHLSTRDSSYGLARHLWADVRPDWPFYSEQQRNEIRRRKNRPDDSVSPASDCSAISPLHSLGSSSGSTQGSPSSQQGGQKRSLQDDRDLAAVDEPAYSEPSNKKQRVAHHKPSPASSSHKPTPTLILPSSTDVNHSSGASALRAREVSVRRDAKLAKQAGAKEARAAGTKRDGLADSPCDDGSRENVDADDTTDYLRQYPELRSVGERVRYKLAFQREFDEYSALHALLASHQRLFKDLQTELKGVPESSDKYTKIKLRVMEEYAALRSSPDYAQQRARCDHLTRKLGHIKQRVEAFDLRQRAAAVAQLEQAS